MTDELDPRAPTWARPARPASSITEAPAFWRQVAATERDPILADEYRHLAEMTDRYLEMAGKVRP